MPIEPEPIIHMVTLGSVRVTFNWSFLDSFLDSFLELLKCGKNEKRLRNNAELLQRSFYKVFLPTFLMTTISRNNFRNDSRNDPRNVEMTYSD